MKRKRFLVIIVLVAVCVPAVVMRDVPLPHLAPPELIPLSREVARIPSRQTHYVWQSNDRFLEIETYPRPGIMQVDVRTGAERSLMNLQKRVGRSALYSIAISPDGKKALWEEAGHGRSFRSTPLDSSSPLSRTLLSDKFWATASNPAWMPDSKRWLQLLATDKGIAAVVCEDGKAEPVQEINIGHPKGTSSGYDLMRTHLLGCTQTGRVLATPEGADGYRNAQDSRHIDFFEFSLDSTHPNVREYTIALPKGEDGYDNNVALARDEEVELSPHGDQLAWLLHRQIEFSAQRWLSRWLPGMATTPRLFTELRITNLDGGDGRTIGMIEFKKNSRIGSDERPFGMHWLPDGRHISFVFNGSVRVVPTQ
ncbi:MAG: hypothetical protein JWL77_2499 [Chthonomonadaceae bacterium]|nr:hypothetical protein [Chthonomonadaceae bacterium]